MAKIIGGIGTSHVPTIGIAFDKGKQNDPDWKPLFKGYEPVAKWLAERKPDVLFFCFNDHATTFFFDHYPTFALGVSEEYEIADEGLGRRPIPQLKGHAPLARHIARSLVEDEFDLTIFQDLPLDHGLHSPLTMMWPSKPDWPARVVPLVVNVLQHPLPTPRRCFKLGQFLRKAIESYPDRKSTRLNSSHSQISYAVFCLKKKKEALGQTIAQRPCPSTVTVGYCHPRHPEK